MSVKINRKKEKIKNIANLNRDKLSELYDWDSYEITLITCMFPLHV